MIKRLHKVLRGWLRKLFCRNELGKGEILILWRDIDGIVCGWDMSADNEDDLIIISKIIERTKLLKLKKMVGKLGEDGSTTLPNEATGET